MIDKVSSSSINITSQSGVKQQSAEPVVQKSAETPSMPIPGKTKAEAPNEKFTEENLKEIVKGMNDFLTPTKTGLKFEFHEQLNEYYVTLVDENTKEVVKEIPSKKLLDFYAAMTESIGWLIDKKI
jgi:flagellar protein FlaG